MPSAGRAQRWDRLACCHCGGTRPHTHGFLFPLSGPWPDSPDNRFFVVFSICSSRCKASGCLFIKYWLLSHLLVFLNQKFYSWLFVQKLHISGVGGERERRQNVPVYHKEHEYKSLPGEDEPFTQLLSEADRGQDRTPLDTSARLAKPETAVSKAPQQQDLAVLLRDLETGETKTRGERCPILTSASQVTFL